MISIESLIDRFSEKDCQSVLPEMFRNYLTDQPLKEIKKLLISILEELDFNTLLIVLVYVMTEEEYLSFGKNIGTTYTKKDFILSLYTKKMQKSIITKAKKYFNMTYIEEIKEDDLELVAGTTNRFYELFDYQVSIKEQLLNMMSLNKGISRMLVHMPTGTGKTKTAMHTIVQYYMDVMKNKGYVVWIAHTNILLEQAIETFKNVWGHLGYGEANIIRFYGGHNLDDLTPNNGIVFASVQKLIISCKKSDYSFNKIFDFSELVIFDEAHKCTARETKKMLNTLMVYTGTISKRSLIGLTATPGRDISNYEENKELVLFFDKNIIKINPAIVESFSKTSIFSNSSIETDGRIIHYFQERKILAKLKKEILSYDLILTNDEFKTIKKCTGSTSDEDDADYSREIIEIYQKNVKRNEVIINKLIELHNANIPTIVFACSVAHGEFLKAMLAINHIESGQVYGKTSKGLRQKTIKDFKENRFNILINYGVLTTGFDSTNIRCVFITKPTRSVVLYSQMIGRGLRGKKMGGNEECLLLDLEDNLNRFKDESKSFSYFDSYWG